MKNTISYKIKQYAKMGMQNVVLPLSYRIACFFNSKIDDNLAIFADAHHDSVPFSMEKMREKMVREGYTVVDLFSDYSYGSRASAFLNSIKFMWTYSRSKYVFICDNFLPVSSCKKRNETKVVQLWHSCGIMKTMGYLGNGDIDPNYKGYVYANYDLIPVSSKACVDWYEKCFRAPKGIVQPLGVSRTDNYFETNWNWKCKKDFFAHYPEAAGKRIVLWAPTFRGEASDAYIIGERDIDELRDNMKEDCFVIKKAHPHVDNNMIRKAGKTVSNCPIPTEKLLPVADIMITDYSSIMFDYMIYNKPIVLYAPDMDEYIEARGLTEYYSCYTPYLAKDRNNLYKVLSDIFSGNFCIPENQEELKDIQMDMCDGSATERIYAYIRKEL